MAKQLNYKKTTSETITVKGFLNDDATTITYLNEDKEEVTISMQTLINKFASMGVAISIKSQTDEELEIEEELENEEE